MKRPLLLLLVGCCWLSRGQPTGGAQAEAELKKLQGAWRPVKLERAGEAVGDAFVPEARFVVDGDTLRLRVGAKTLQEVRLTLDPEKKPAAVNLTSLAGPTKGKTVLGIYRLEGNRLTLCWPLADDRARPAAFGKPGERDVVVLTLERE